MCRVPTTYNNHDDIPLWILDESDSKIYSNYITLVGGKVSFIEDIDMFKIHCEFSKDQVEVKKDLVDAINETITTRQIIKEMQPKVAFYCPCEMKSTHIAIVLKEDNRTLLCLSKQMSYHIFQKTVLILVGLGLSPLMMVCSTIYLLY